MVEERRVTQPADFLGKILTQKAERLKVLKEGKPVSQLQQGALRERQASKAHYLRQQLHNDHRFNVIAEFKRRSPSKGVIRANARASSIAQSYQEAGAAAISVLTEEDFFDGSLRDLKEVRLTVDLPILRKDFIIDSYQIYETAEAGADAILLIVAALDDSTLRELLQVAEAELGMDALVEVHDQEEMERARAAGATLIGVNNRNLRTFEVSLEVSKQLANYAGDDVTLITESGLTSKADLQVLYDFGYRGFLIGEQLMKADDPEIALREILGDE